MAKRLAKGRREELLDGVMGIIAARGFSGVRISELAAELHCSVASLYKIAPSKDSLVLLAIGRWQELTFANLELCAERGTDRLGAGTLLLHQRGGEPPSSVPGLCRRRSAF